MKKSKRLDCIGGYVDQYAKGMVLADIGTDHGYLPCYLIENHSSKFVYACDVAINPLNACKKNVMQKKMDHSIQMCLGNGLEPVIDYPVEVVTISGMGGLLMEQILKKDLHKLKHVQFLILQPNVGCDVVRKYLLENGWSIIDETVLEDMHHFYEVIVFQHKQCGIEQMNSYSYQFGPVLLKNKDDNFIKKWNYELNIKKRILIDLKEKHDQQRYQQIVEQIKLIEEVLNEN